MGCGSSTLASEEEVPVIEVPGWNGVVYPQMSARQTMPLTYGHEEQFTADISGMTAQIMGASTAGNGSRLVAFHYPVAPGWTDGSLGGRPYDIKAKGMMDTSPDSFGTMVFQQVDVPASPLETKVVSSEMSFEISVSVSDFKMTGKTTGYEELFSNLKLLGDEGYSLSAVLAGLDKKKPGLLTASTAGGVARAVANQLVNPASKSTTTSTVTLVGQRVAGAAPRATTYIVQDVPIDTTGHRKMHSGNNSGGQNIKATMPTLHATLEEHFGPKRCKLAAVYKPPLMMDKESVTSDKVQFPCHLIFEPTDEPYAVCVVDTAVRVKMGLSTSTVDYTAYLSVIENFVAKGWQLATVIDMPDQVIRGFTGFASTVKLVFQAKSTQPGLVTATVAPVPVP